MKKKLLSIIGLCAIVFSCCFAFMGCKDKKDDQGYICMIGDFAIVNAEIFEVTPGCFNFRIALENKSSEAKNFNYNDFEITVDDATVQFNLNKLRNFEAGEYFDYSIQATSAEYLEVGKTAKIYWQTKLILTTTITEF